MRMRGAKRLLFALILFDGLLFGTLGAVVQTGRFADGALQAGSVMKPAEPEPEEGQEQGIKSVQKLLALTFDDGPSAECTKVLLDGLKQRGIHATFFLMGENIPGKEALVVRMKEEGHLIANHGYRHVQMTHEGEEAVAESVEKAQEMIEAITGEEPEFLRPPYGDWNEKLAERCDLTTVFWNVDSLDWKLRNVEKIVRRVKKQVRNGDIILMHDIFPESVEAALELADQLGAEGYMFVTVDELLID
ncbi:polysaccharide deacetylase family protein [Brotaphodocola sp.]|uniref:polysaccharide deacetylase family protein n=1 Tax=Brotaphodocola sp. TaxID=3073577 RepID=UPI003D7EE42C